MPSRLGVSDPRDIHSWVKSRSRKQYVKGITTRASSNNLHHMRLLVDIHPWNKEHSLLYVSTICFMFIADGSYKHEYITFIYINKMTYHIRLILNLWNCGGLVVNIESRRSSYLSQSQLNSGPTVSSVSNPWLVWRVCRLLVFERYPFYASVIFLVGLLRFVFHKILIFASSIPVQ